MGSHFRVVAPIINETKEIIRALMRDRFNTVTGSALATVMAPCLNVETRRSAMAFPRFLSDKPHDHHVK